MCAVSVVNAALARLLASEFLLGLAQLGDLGFLVR